MKRRTRTHGLATGFGFDELSRRHAALSSHRWYSQVLFLGISSRHNHFEVAAWVWVGATAASHKAKVI